MKHTIFCIKYPKGGDVFMDSEIQLNDGLVDLTCIICGESFRGEEPKMCCSGRECGCMGLPIDPVVCSKECYEKGLNQNTNGIK